jgi:hypothetical protein
MAAKRELTAVEKEAMSLVIGEHVIVKIRGKECCDKGVIVARRITRNGTPMIKIRAPRPVQSDIRLPPTVRHEIAEYPAGQIYTK